MMHQRIVDDVPGARSSGRTKCGAALELVVEDAAQTLACSRERTLSPRRAQSPSAVTTDRVSLREASSSSSVVGAASTRIKEAIGEAYPGFKNLRARCFCSEAVREMLDLAIKEKKITEDDGAAANVICGFLRKAFQAQDLVRAAYEGSDAESLFQDEVESGALFLADIQLRAELPAAAAKTAYDTVVAKRDKRSFKATKSGVVFIFEEQAKIYEDYYKAQLKADTTGKSGRAASDRALAGKDSAASTAKQLAAAKKKIETLERREQGAQRRARQVEAAATAGGIELPKGQNQERAAARKRAPAAAGPAKA